MRFLSRAARRAAPALAPDVESLNYRGVRLELPAAVLTERIRHAFDENYYEAAEAGELGYLLQPGEIVLEIGAGIGFISTLCAKDSRVTAVYAVEANPELVPICRRTYELNGVSVTIYNEMLGPQDGTATFHLYRDFWASSGNAWDGSKRVQVAMTSFQKRLDEIAPTLLIVDIEGGELDLFDGIALPSVRKIMMEVHQNVIGRAGMKKVFDTLSLQNFHYDQWHSSKGIVTFSAIDRDER
jgi:FkbM family methyltransferase